MQKSALVTAFLATIVQYYDYALFGISASALASHYIPSHDQTSILSFFAILSGASLMRPIGSLFFGWIGDNYNKAICVKLSIFAAALSTISIGIIPSYNSITSTCYLIVARMIFIMSMAGESDGVKIYVAEIIGPRKEFFGNGIVTFSSQIGVLIASLAWCYGAGDIVTSNLWRMNFIAGGICGVVILFFSKNIISSSNDHVKTVGKTINITSYLIALVILGIIGGVYHFQIIFFGNFMSKIANVITSENASVITTSAVALYAISSIISGYIADLYNCRHQILVAIAVSVLCSIITCKYQNILLHLLITFLIPFYSVPMQMILRRMMPQKAMVRAFSLLHSFGSIIFSASTPFISILLWKIYGTIYMPFIYMTFLLIILFISSYIILGRHSDVI